MQLTPKRDRFVAEYLVDLNATQTAVRVGYKLKALELLMKHLGLAAPEQHQHLHQHVHFTPEQLNRMTDEQLDRAEAAYTTLVALEQEVESDEAQRARFSARAADRGGPRNSDSLLRWDPDQGEGVWNATEATELSC